MSTCDTCQQHNDKCRCYTDPEHVCACEIVTPEEEEYIRKRFGVDQ